MKTEYKYIKFVPTTLTGHWNCLNRKSESTLGAVSYYRPWRQFVYEPNELGDIIFNSSCLRDIAHFLDQLNAQKQIGTNKAKQKAPAASGENSK